MPIIYVYSFLNLILGGYVVLKWFRSYQLGRLAQDRYTGEDKNTPSALPPVSVIIPAWNEETVLEMCLTQLQSVSYPEWEIIIVAGGTDKTLELAKALSSRSSLDIQVVEQNPDGKNAAIMKGYQFARFDVIVFLDADTLVSQNWLVELVQPLSGDIVATCGNYFPINKTWVSCFEQMEKISAYMIRQQVILQGSGSIAIYRHIFDAIGGLPSEIKVGVDWELNTQLRQNNYKIAFAHNAQVDTHRPATIFEFLSNEIRWRRAHLHSLWRNRDHSELNIGHFLAYFHYMMALIPVVGIVIFSSLLVYKLEQAAILSAVIVLSIIFWLCLSRISLVIEVYRFTLNRRWLQYIWVPPVLLLIGFVGIWVSLLTIYRIPVQFKGPRNDLEAV